MQKGSNPGGGPATRPRISVVIASVNGWHVLRECLEALHAQAGDHPFEVVLVDRCGPELRRRVAAAFPTVRLVEVAPEATIPDMRARGLRLAQGDLVAVTEDHCLARPGWFDAMVRAHAGHALAAVGGPVENAAAERLVDRAAFLCEYSQLMGPLPAGPAENVAGNNVVYRREALETVRDVVEAGVWEHFLHAAIRERGGRFAVEPALAIDHKKSFGFGEFMSQRYHYSRSFAGMRVQGKSALVRAAWAAASPLLVPLVLGRIGRAVAAKRRHVGDLVTTAPLLALFSVSYWWGELVGSLLGPGRSLERVQ